MAHSLKHIRSIVKTLSKLKTIFYFLFFILSIKTIKQLKCYRENNLSIIEKQCCRTKLHRQKIEFTTPSVNTNLSQSQGLWFVQASQTYVHFTQKKKKNAIIVSKFNNTSK